MTKEDDHFIADEAKLETKKTLHKLIAMKFRVTQNEF